MLNDEVIFRYNQTKMWISTRAFAGVAGIFGIVLSFVGRDWGWSYLQLIWSIFGGGVAFFAAVTWLNNCSQYGDISLSSEEIKRRDGHKWKRTIRWSDAKRVYDVRCLDVNLGVNRREIFVYDGKWFIRVDDFLFNFRDFLSALNEAIREHKIVAIAVDRSVRSKFGRVAAAGLSKYSQDAMPVNDTEGRRVEALELETVQSLGPLERVAGGGPAIT
jgi:hypothetical protein